MSKELTHKLIVIGKKNHPSIYERGIGLEVVITYANVAGDWRIKIIEYLEDPNRQVPDSSAVGVSESTIFINLNSTYCCSKATVI